MSYNLNSTLLLVGTGEMAFEYAKVLKALNTKFLVVGRSATSAELFFNRTGVKPVIGGLEKFLNEEQHIFEKVIIAVNIEELSSVTYRLVDRSKNILVEKPAGLNFNDITDLYLHSYQKNMNVYVAYNRRFYSSVLKAMEIINDDGGVNSFNFEFTEWAHIIENINQSEEVKKNWFLANSTHVIDLAFYIGGKPQKICCYTSGSLNWHPKAAVFSGAGETKNGILFNYQANWNAPGRWGVEVLTKFHRIILQPLEKLKVQEKGSVIIKDVDIDDIIDIDYKPGLYRQVKNFLGNNFENILSLSDHVMNCEYYKKILGE